MIDINQYIIKGIEICTFEYMCPYCYKIFVRPKVFDKHIFKHLINEELEQNE